MTTEWSALEEELDAWAAQALTLPLWWRDDDAISATPELERLTGLSEETGLPVHLAIIPAGAAATLARHISVHPQMIPVVHGWAHENHSPAGEKKAEFGSHRETETVRADIAPVVVFVDPLHVIALVFKVVVAAPAISVDLGAFDNVFFDSAVQRLA